MIERILKYTIPLSLLLLTACAHDDEPVDGMRHMEFSVSIFEQPQSRVSETADGMGSTWSTGDRIFVQVTQDGVSSSSYCTLSSSGKVTAYSTNLYWKGTAASANVLAWYSNITGSNSTAMSTINLADQSKELAYVLRAYATANYGSKIPLNFSHQLAKVRVKVTGDGAAEVNTVKINNYQTCNITNGYVSAESSGYITAMKNGEYFEANVVPTTNVPDDLISFDGDFAVKVDGIYKLDAGKVYTITIDAKRKVENEPVIDVNGHTGVMMREATDDLPALYLADRNIGAINPEDAGLYFWWGDVVGHKHGEGFNFYKDNAAITTYGKTIQELYNGKYISTNNKSTAVLMPGYDAAEKQWGGGWRIPTDADWQWLIDNCTWTWQENDEANGVRGGYKIVSPATGREVFLPAVGNCDKLLITAQLGYGGYYWCSSPDDFPKYSARFLYIYHTRDQHYTSGVDVYLGLTIRPVIEK